MMLPHTNLFQLDPKLLNLILRIFIPSIITRNIRRSEVDGSGGNMLCFLLYRLLVGYVNVPTRTNVLWSVRLGRDRSGPWNRPSSLVGMPLVRMRRLLLSMFLLGLCSVGIIGVVGNVRRWCVGPLWF